MTPKFDLISVITSDMATSIAFYQQLGLSFPPGSEAEQHVEGTLPGGLRFALDTTTVIQSFDPQWVPTRGSHRIGLAFLCDSATEVDELYTQLVGSGGTAHLPPWDAVWGQRYAIVLDPDGNAVDLFANMPQA